MSQRDFIRIWHLGPFACQILMHHYTGLVIRITPAVTLTIAGKCLLVGIGLDWIFSDINLGIMNKKFRENEKKRLRQIEISAKKQGLTSKQYRLRWGW